MTKENIIEKEWLDFVKRIYHNRLPPNSKQYIEQRKTFYSGFIDALTMISIDMRIRDKELTTILSDLKPSIDEFLVEITLNKKDKK